MKENLLTLEVPSMVMKSTKITGSSYKDTTKLAELKNKLRQVLWCDR